MYTACIKLETPTQSHGVRLVLEEDGTDIDRTAVLPELCAKNGVTLMLLGKNEHWSPRGADGEIRRTESG